MNMRPNATTGCPGRTHRFYSGPTVYPFGAGLSHTTLTHSLLVVSGTRLSRGDLDDDIAVNRYHSQRSQAAVTVELHVTNISDRDGAETILGFVIPPGAGQNGRPLRNLKQYEKVLVAAGKTRHVSLTFSKHDFSLAGSDGSLGSATGTYTLQVGDLAVPDSVTVT